MSYDYFYGQSGELFSYFRIPKALFQDSRFRQLSTDARTLYGILLDRMSLSAKNGWLDEQGRVYIMNTATPRHSGQNWTGCCIISPWSMSGLCWVEKLSTISRWDVNTEA